jgi:hypothetical protein
LNEGDEAAPGAVLGVLTLGVATTDAGFQPATPAPLSRQNERCRLEAGGPKMGERCAYLRW